MQLFPDKRQVGQLDELLLQNQSDFFANGAAQGWQMRRTYRCFHRRHHAFPPVEIHV
jgi:hypothetical protein